MGLLVAQAVPAAAAPAVGAPELVADLCPGPCSSRPGELTPLGNRLFFTTWPRTDEVMTGLWRLAPETGELIALAPGTGFESLFAVGELLFRYRSESFLEAVAADGSPVELLEAGGQLFNPPAEMGGLLFVPLTGLDGLPQIWVSDGTPAGTRRLGKWDVSCAAFPGDTRLVPDALTVAGDTLYLVLFRGPGDCGQAIWKTDGTPEGTVRVTDAALSSGGTLAPLGGGIVYATYGARNQPFEGTLWFYDGTGTPRQIASFEGTLGSPFAAGGRVYFRAADDGEAASLWVTDGTEEGTISLGVEPHHGPLAAAADGRLFFVGEEAGTGAELWVTDGTPQGTRLVHDLRPGAEGGAIVSLTAVGDLIAFNADDGVTGLEPWVTDGTPEGTVPIGDLRPGPQGSAPFVSGPPFARLGGFLYFAADDGLHGSELWRVAVEMGAGAPPPGPPAEITSITAPELPGFRLWVRITAGGEVQPARREEACIPETVCISGALPGRSELFVRMVGPKGNGRLWPTLVRFSTSEIEVWIEQPATWLLRSYRLPGATPGSSDLDGLFDRDGFLP